MQGYIRAAANRLGGSGRSRLAFVAVLIALTLAVSTSPAAASVTIGQVGFSGPACGSDDEDWLQPTVTSGTPYVVPPLPPAVNLVVNSWSTSAGTGAGQLLTMKIFRPVAGNIYMVVGHDGPRTLTPSAVNTFPVNVPVKPGDVLGFHTGSPDQRCVNSDPAQDYLALPGNLQDGESGDFMTFSSFRLNVSAVVAPSNSFALGGVKRNKKKGTATLTVDVPNPGELSVSGKGVKAAGVASSARAVAGPGKVKLTIRAKGKKRRKLNRKGKVKVKPKLTYTPTGGSVATQTTKVKLRKKV